MYFVRSARLLGGHNVYGYAPNPVSWIDPLGLNNNPICVFGNKTEPKGIRDKDLQPDENGILPSQKDKAMPEGKSATRLPEKSGLSGHYHKVPADTPMPEGLAIKHDGKDIIPGSKRGEGHSTIYPTRDMPQSEFNEKLQSIPWSYGGKI